MDQCEGEGVVTPIVFVLARNVGRGKVERDHLIELHRQRAVSGSVLVTVAVGVDAVDFSRIDPLDFELRERKRGTDAISDQSAAEAALIKIIAPRLNKSRCAGGCLRISGGHQDDATCVGSPHQTLWSPQNLNAGEPAAEKMLYSGANLWRGGICDVDAVQHDTRAVALFAANADCGRFSIPTIHGDGDARLGIE